MTDHKHKLESETSSELQDILRANSMYVKKTHGNQFSQGLPDLLVMNDYGMFFIELKVWKKKVQPDTIDALYELFNGPYQKNFYENCVKRNIRAYIIADLQDGRYAFTDTVVFGILPLNSLVLRLKAHA